MENNSATSIKYSRIITMGEEKLDLIFREKFTKKKEGRRPFPVIQGVTLGKLLVSES